VSVDCWPEATVYDLPLVPAAVDGEFFVHLWGDFPPLGSEWFVCADVQGPGPGGKPRTKIAPGIGYPTGWQDVAIVWGPTLAMGIGAYLGEAPIPVQPVSWGAVKQLYRGSDR